MKHLLCNIGAVVLFYVLSGCSSAQVAQTPVTFPHVVGTVSPLQLVLVADGPVIQYQIMCVDNGQYRDVSVEFHSTNRDGGSGQGGPPDALATCTAGTTVLENVPLPTIGAGDTIDVTFKVTAPNGRPQQITRSLSKGADGTFRSNAR